MSDEFSRIAKYFAPLAGEEGRGLTDDAAVLAPPPGRELVLTVDQMLELSLIHISRSRATSDRWNTIR